MIHFLIDQRLRTKQVEEQGDRSNLTDISASFGNQQTTPLLTYRSKIWRFPKSWGYPKWMVYKGKSIYKWMIHMKNHPELAKMFGLWFFSTLPKKSWSTGLTSAIHCLSHKCTGPIFFSHRFSIFSALTSELTNDQREPPLYLWITTMVTTISFFFQWISIIGPEIWALFQVDKLMNDLNKLVGLTKARPVFDLEKHGWVLQRFPENGGSQKRRFISWKIHENPIKSGWFGG